MLRVSRPILTGCLLLMSFSNLLAQAVQARHARVELLSAQLGSNGQAWLGVHFSLEKDWHIYWVNPGDSGLPPVLKWQLPPGFKAGEIQWPLPEKLKRSTLADYGYQDDVVLLVPLHFPADFKKSGQAEIGLQAKWLICREVCIADHADLRLSAISSTPAPGQQKLFAEAKKRLPKPWPSSWKAGAASDKNSFVLSIQTGAPVKAAEFFPLVPQQIENAAPQPLQPTEHGAKITLTKSDQLLKSVRVLKGLLVLGNGESYQIQAPVAPTPTKADNN